MEQLLTSAFHQLKHIESLAEIDNVDHKSISSRMQTAGNDPA